MKIILRLTTLLIFSIGFRGLLFAQPANDNCSGAQNLGILPAPGGTCSSGVYNGAPVTVNTTNVGATAANPYVYITGCTGPAAPVPSRDVWYSFVASGYTLNVTVSGGTLGAAYIAVYQGSCGNLQGRGCAVGTTGTTTLTVGQLIIGQTYYIQVGGATPTAEGTFTLSVENDNDCAPCLVSSYITANPPPVNGAYQPGQQVDFCFTVDRWTIQSTNWFHGVQVSYGSGWAGISNQVPAASCDGGGIWKWTNNNVTGNSGVTFGPGFYYDRDNDDLFHDNYGDNCQGPGRTWTFCFRLTVAANCNPGSDLSVTINTTGDGESGSWTSIACVNDDATRFFAIGSCCPPTMSSTPSCPAPATPTGSVTATPVGSASPYTYSWVSGGNTVSTSSGVPGANTVNNLPPGNYTVFVTDVNNCQISNNVTVAADPVPNVTAGNNGPICSGTSANLTSSGATTYSWSTGATTNNTSVSPTSTTTYTVWGTNASGCTNTATTTVTVNSVPTAELIGGGSICNGSSIPLTVNLGGTGPWNLVYNNGSSNVNVNNITTSPYIIDAFASGNYTLVSVANAQCSGTVSGSANVSINTSPTAVISGGGTICAGETATITVDLTGTGPWTIRYDDGSSNVVTVPNITTSPYTFTTGTAGTYVLTDVSDANCSGPVSGSAVVTVNPIPNVDPIPDVTYCNSVLTAPISFSGNVTGTTYNWTNSNTSVGLAASGSGNINAFNATNSGTSPINANIVVTPVAAGCTGSPTNFTITVNPTPNVMPITDQTVCNGDNFTAVNFTGNVTGTTFNWTNSNNSIGLNASGSGDIASFTGVNAGNAPSSATVTVTPSANGCDGNLETFTLTVNPTPIVNAIADQTYCNGDAAPVTTISSPVTGATFNWTNSNTTVGLGASGIGNVSGFAATNSGTTSVSSLVSVTPIANGCSGPITNYTITVNPTPQVNPLSNQDYCNGATVSATAISGNVAGATYNWTNTNTSIGLAANGVGDVPGYIATNTGNTVVTANITVVASANGCTGASQSFTVSVNPTPSLNPVPADVAYCNGATTNQETLSGPVAGTTFSWTNDNTTIGLAASGTGNVPSFTADNSSNAPVVATITITPSANGCVGNTESYTYTINPTPKTDPLNDFSFCNGDNVPSINLNSTPPGATFNWNNNNTAVGLAANGTGPIPSFTATNLTANVLTAIVTITPELAGCAGPDSTVLITVSPSPVLNTIPNQQYCNGNNANATLFATTPVGSTYAWTNSNNAITLGAGASGTGNFPAFTAINQGALPLTTTVTVTPTLNGCVGQSASFTITVNPQPVADAGTDQDICIGGIANLNGSGGTSCVWQPTPTGGNTCVTTTSPASTTTYTLIVTDANGCADTSTVDVIVHANPIADFSSTSVCLGGTTQFTDLSTPPSGESISTYTWTLEAGNFSSLPNPIYNYQACGTIQASLTVATPYGCSASVIKPVQVYCLPVAEFSITDDTLCVGEAAQFNNQTFSSIGFTSLWTFGQGQGTSTANNPTYNYPAMGVYDVNLIVTTSEGCKDTASTQQVYVFDSPLADFTASQVCLNNPTTFNNLTQPNGNTGLTYTWNFGNGSTSNQQEPSHTYLTYGVYNVQLTVNSAEGCMANVTKPVEVYPIPLADFTATTVCLGAPTVYTVTSAVATSTYSWDYTSDGVLDGFGSSSSHVFATAGTDSTTLMVTNVNGCTSSIKKPVTVNALPKAGFRADVLEGCEPLQVTFTDTSSVANSTIVAWNWNLGNNSSGNSSTPTTTYSAGTYNVQLVVVTNAGCRDTIKRIDYITSHPRPIARFDYSPTQIQETNGVVMFTDQSVGNVVAWLWNFGDTSETSQKTLQNPIHTYSDTGIYCVDLRVTTDKGCVDSTVKCLKVNPEFIIYIPNSFTPNDDGVNEKFFPKGRGFNTEDGYELLIFDRWGNLIFRASRYTDFWDGTHQQTGEACQIDTYVYRLNVKDIFDKKHQFTGQVHLVR